MKPSSTIVIFGEVLFDCFGDGHKILGGAPFNVAWSLQGFGHAPYLVSAVGKDAMGQSIQDKMERWGMSTSGVACDEKLSTGAVNVVIEDGEPHYDICHPRAWDNIRFNAANSTLDLKNVNILYHGSLALRSNTNRTTFEALLAQTQAQRFFDVNLRPPHYDKATVLEFVKGVEWLKINIDECSLLLGRDVDFVSSLDPLQEFRDKYNVGNIILTAGAQGALISGVYGAALHQPAPTPSPFVDAVGAGDAFAATTIHGIIHHATPERIVTLASQFAAKVCSNSGATNNEKSFYTFNQ